MKKNNLVRRYIVFLFGLFIGSLGVAFVKKQVWVHHRFPVFLMY